MTAKRNPTPRNNWVTYHTRLDAKGKRSRKPAGVQTQRVRKVYVGGKRDEAKLAGKCGFIGSVYEVLIGAGAIQPSDRPNYIRTRAAFYRLHPDHPGHPQWCPEWD